MIKTYNNHQIAEVIHTVNGLLQRFNGEEHQQPPWSEAPEAMRQRVYALIDLYKGGGSARQGHERWLAAMTRAGWRWGAAYDPIERTHPNIVAYEDLDWRQKVKDMMSHQVTLVMAGGADL